MYKVIIHHYLKFERNLYIINIKIITFTYIPESSLNRTFSLIPLMFGLESFYCTLYLKALNTSKPDLNFRHLQGVMVIYQSHNMSHLLQLFKDLKSEKKSLEVSEERMKDALQEVMEATCTPGHFLCWMLNATYRTTKYGLSLFFLAVKTNVDTQVVAAFVTEDVRMETVSSARTFIKKVNQKWTSKHLW